MFRKEDGAVDMTSLILTVVIAAVTLMVGIVIVAQMESGVANNVCTMNDTWANMTLHNFTYTSKLGCHSFGPAVWSNVMTNSGTAFTFMALGLFVLAAVFVIGIIAGVLGKGE
jgi:ABC-type polysaccharide/polyol phosphate export permease